MTENSVRTDPADLRDLADSVDAVLQPHADGPIAVDTAATAAVWATATDLGWTGIGLAEERGGSGGGLDELVALLRVVGRWAAPGPFLGTAAAAVVLEMAGSPAVGLDNGVAPAMLTRRPGRRRVLQALPGTTHALLLGEREVAVVPLIGLDAAGEGPFDPAVGVAEVEALGAPAAQVRAADVRGRLGLLVAAQALGIADRMTETAAEYAGQREQFGRPIGSFQAVKHRCADMAIRQRAALGAVTSALTKDWQCDPEAGLAADIACDVATAAALENAEACLETHGAIGHTWEFAGHRFLKRAHVLRGIAAVLARGEAASE